MAFKNQLKDYKQTDRFKNLIIVMLFALLAYNTYKISSYPDSITTYTPPDVTKAFKQKAGVVPKSTVYGFARGLWEQLYYCREDCSTDFITSLNKYKALLSNSCYNELKKHHENNQSIYSLRSRRLLATPDEQYNPEVSVQTKSNNVWHLPLSFILEDNVRGINTRREIIAYPLRVIRSNQPKSYNPWGLELDCYYADGPKYLGKGE